MLLVIRRSVIFHIHDPYLTGYGQLPPWFFAFVVFSGYGTQTIELEGTFKFCIEGRFTRCRSAGHTTHVEGTGGWRLCPGSPMDWQRWYPRHHLFAPAPPARFTMLHTRHALSQVSTERYFQRFQCRCIVDFSSPPEISSRNRMVNIGSALIRSDKPSIFFIIFLMQKLQYHAVCRNLLHWSPYPEIRPPPRVLSNRHRSLRGGIRQTFTGTVRRDEVFQYLRPSLKVGEDRVSMISLPWTWFTRLWPSIPSNLPAAWSAACYHGTACPASCTQSWNPVCLLPVLDQSFVTLGIHTTPDIDDLVYNVRYWWSDHVIVLPHPLHPVQIISLFDFRRRDDQVIDDGTTNHLWMPYGIPVFWYHPGIWVVGTSVHLMISPIISLSDFLVSSAFWGLCTFWYKLVKQHTATVVSMSLYVNVPSALRTFAFTLICACRSTCFFIQLWDPSSALNRTIFLRPTFSVSVDFYPLVMWCTGQHHVPVKAGWSAYRSAGSRMLWDSISNCASRMAAQWYVYRHLVTIQSRRWTRW